MAVSAIIYFAKLGERALWLDEGYTAWFIALDWRQLWLETPAYETHPPLYYSLLKLWTELFGNGAAGLRSLSAVAAVALVPVAALAAREIASLTGFRRPLLLLSISCALAALSPRLLLVAQDARPYVLLLLAYSIAATFWLRLANSFRRSAPAEGLLRDWAGLGIGTALTLWLHGVGLLYGTALLGALLLTSTPGATPARWTRLATTVLLVFVSYLPCLLMIAGRQADWSSGWIDWDLRSFPGAFLDLFALYYHGEPVTPVLSRVLGVLLLFLGLRSLWRAGRPNVACGMMMLVLFPPLASAAISQLGSPIFLPRTMTGLLVPAYLLFAIAIAAAPRHHRLLLGGALALLYSVNLGQALNRPSLEAWDEVAAVIAKDFKAGDAIWVYPNEAALPLERALQGSAFVRAVPAPFPALHVSGPRPVASPGVVGMEPGDAARWAARHQPQPGANIWLVMGTPEYFDPDNEIARALATDRMPGVARRWNKIVLRPLHPRT